MHFTQPELSLRWSDLIEIKNVGFSISRPDYVTFVKVVPLVSVGKLNHLNHLLFHHDPTPGHDISQNEQKGLCISRFYPNSMGAAIHVKLVT